MKRAAENKTKPTDISVTSFINDLVDETRRADAKTLVTLLQATTGEKPKMWGSSIVGFGSHHYKYESGREGEAPLVSFSPRKAATVLYGITAFSGSEALLAKLGRYTTAGGCIYIKKLSEVDGEVLQELAAKSVEAKRASPIRK